ncbi:FGGY family carbohydrate kinase [Paradesertivirga mongoliensis]|uniref:ATP:glycerol 3-phosphotransferase n=1 Tax=Paradesertivirga mongoliensis TaxID=2100740 RepID=A0ABW4ZQY1_9SPHI|nr:glycerol kinase GlpK [Pedobacter mongoliensis]
MQNSLILAIDQGTSSTKTIVFDNKGAVLAKTTEALVTNYMESGWVEQDPDEIYKNVISSVEKCVAEFLSNGGSLADIKTCGISNQRETFVVWDKAGNPLYPAIVWQCKRSIKVCSELKRRGLEGMLKHKTGLIVDPYFSASKLIWLNENNAEVKNAISGGEAFFGTVDTWLLYKLTNGQKYLTDYSNASRTLLFNLHSLQWDLDIVETFGLTGINLPEPKPSAYNFGSSSFEGIFAEPLSISSMIGDSHAAAFGEGCFSPGTAKATLGTGCSVLKNIGPVSKSSESGMITTICWSTESRVDYALEGVIVSCGSVIEWLKNELALFSDSRQTELMANEVADNNGVYIVPAFSGLGAPYWDMTRKASIQGLTFDCTKNHIVRAALEAIAFQIKDVLDAMQADTGVQINQLMLNGGMTSNTFVLEFLADLLDCTVVNGKMPDVSALGAAYLAGLGIGIFGSIDDIKELHGQKPIIESGKYKANIQRYYQGWKAVIEEKAVLTGLGE